MVLLVWHEQHYPACKKVASDYLTERAEHLDNSNKPEEWTSERVYVCVHYACACVCCMPSVMVFMPL